MKKIIRIMALAAVAVVMMSCGAAKKAAVQQVVENATDAKKIEIPLDGPQYKSDSEYFRETISAVSRDMAVAKQMAVHEARQAMASTIQTAVQSVTKSYVDQITGSSGVAGEAYKHFQSMGVSVADLTLSGAEIVGEELYQLPDGSYRYHVCLQLSKESLAKAAAKAVEAATEAANAEADEKHEFNEASFEEFFVEAIKMVR